MKIYQSVVKFSLVAATAAGLAGCAVRVGTPYRYDPPPPVYAQPPPPPPATGEIIVSAPPPPPPVEVQIAAPGPEFVWIPGAWVWEGRWIWHRGYYGRPPRAGVRWYGPHYEFRAGRHVYFGGGWR